MTEDWDHYLCALGEDLASVYLDLGKSEIGPIHSLPHLFIISVSMLRAKDNGMSSDAEFNDLCKMEDDFTALIAGKETSYVGRLTTQGRRIFYFYTADPVHLEAGMTSMMTRHASYQFEASSRPDPNWGAYYDFLYPRPEDYQRMMNRRLN